MSHRSLKIVFTGGPSAGKTNILQVLQKNFADVLMVVPETASILYAGGYPRWQDPISKTHTQKAIYLVQKELEEMFKDRYPDRHLLMDRGTLDGLAYWPLHPIDFFKAMNTSQEAEFARYDWVIHLDPACEKGYDLNNPLRTESPQQALELNERLVSIWSTHPKYFRIRSFSDFFKKVRLVEALIRHILSGHDLDSPDIQRFSRFLKS